VQEAILDPSKHNAMTKATLERLENMGLDYVEHVRETGELPPEMDFSHLLTVADFPEFAHRGEEVGFGAEHREHQGEHHAGDPTAPLDAAAPRESPAEAQSGFHVEFSPEGGVIRTPNRGAIREHRAILQGYERKAASTRRRAESAARGGRATEAQRLAVEAERYDALARQYREAIPQLEQLVEAATPEGRRDLGRPSRE
jgi:hypothetical protein